MAAPTPDSIARRARLDLVRYANVWEDARLLLAALPLGPGRRILSIASGGDNAFALLATGAEVVAVDLSPAQLAMVELKTVAIRALDRDALLAFLGFADADPEARRETYAELARTLSRAARRFWDPRADEIRAGVGHAGRFERYFSLFRRRVLPLVHSARTARALLAPRPPEERRRFYDERWDGWRWRLLFRLFFGRFTMGRLGRDPEFFRYVEGSVADRLHERARYAITDLDPADNPWLAYILTGSFGPALPPYLEAPTLPRVRENLGRLRLVEGAIDAAALADREALRGDDGGFDGYNLSDLFEYLDPATCAGLYRNLLATARPGARFAYWNMLVPRRRPDALATAVRSLDDEAAALHARDRAFFYSRFVLEEVVEVPA